MIKNTHHESTTLDNNYIYIGTYEVGEILIDSLKIRKPSVVIIRIKCPYCHSEYDIRFASLKHSKSKCTKCCNKYSNSFAHYIEKELKEPLDKYWDWDKNIVNPYHISKSSNKQIWVKCNNTNYHESYMSRCCYFTRGNRCPYCSTKHGRVHPKDSFAQYHIDNTDEDFLNKYWSDKNEVDPWSITPCSNNIKVIIKDIYGVEKLIQCNKFTSRIKSRNEISFRSGLSFGQWGIDNLGSDFITKYWSDKNNLNPFDITYGSDDKVLIKCTNTDYHDDYFVTCHKFTTGNHRCPQCSHKGKSIHPKDSFGGRHPQKLKYWSNKNKVSPMEVYPHTKEQFLFNCSKCTEEFYITMESLNYKTTEDVCCKKCNATQGESKIITYLNDSNLDYVYDTPYFDDLLSPKGNPLRPDFILPKQKIWIEYDGEFHYLKLYPGDGHETIVINDEIKNNYAKLNGWKLIRIPYWEFDNIEIILMNEINKNGGNI